MTPQLMYKENLCVHCGRCFIPCQHEECKPFGRCLHSCANGCLSISGHEVNVEELAKQLTGYRDFLSALHGGITDTAENLTAVANIVGDYPVEYLPYNTLAGAKYPLLGLQYPFDKKNDRSDEQPFKKTIIQKRLTIDFFCNIMVLVPFSKYTYRLNGSSMG